MMMMIRVSVELGRAEVYLLIVCMMYIESRFAAVFLIYNFRRGNKLCGDNKSGKHARIRQVIVLYDS